MEALAKTQTKKLSKSDIKKVKVLLVLITLVMVLLIGEIMYYTLYC